MDKRDFAIAAEAASECLNFNLRKAARTFGQIYDAALKPVHLTGTQFSLLNALALAGPVSISMLAERLTADRTTLTRVARPLQDQGLIAERADIDRRRRVLTLTAKGRQAHARALPLWRGVQDRVAEHIGEERLERMIDDLTAAVAAFRAS